MTATHAKPASVPAGPSFTAPARVWLRAAAVRLPRRSRTAAAKAAGAPIGPGERVLTFDRGLAGSQIVATRAALYCQNTGEHGRGWSRLGWEGVDRAGWDERRRVLILTGVGPGGVWRKELALPPRTMLVELARDRVTSTVLASTAVRAGDRVCALVTARRRPASGTVVWTVLLNGARDNGDRVIWAGVAAAITGLQAPAGISAEADAGELARQLQRDHLGIHACLRSGQVPG